MVLYSHAFVDGIGDSHTKPDKVSHVYPHDDGCEFWHRDAVPQPFFHFHSESVYFCVFNALGDFYTNRDEVFDVVIFYLEDSNYV